MLDLGCGSGALGRHLQGQGQGGIVFDGLTISTDEAQLASEHYRRVEVADLETVNLPELFEAASYDIIVCADVLEHIRHPERVLAQCKQLLAPEGQVLLSIPNVAYSGLIAELMAGEFHYRKEGLLDETHVHFFTRQTLLRFLQAGGWTVEHFEVIARDLIDSEFRVAFDALPPSVARYLLALPDAQSYQFIVNARPDPAAPDTMDGTAADIPRPEGLFPAQAQFSAQLYWDNGQGYAENRKQVQAGAIGEGHQRLVFKLPQGEPLRELKLDPADRTGILYLYGLSLRDAASNQPVWEWSMQRDGANPLLTGLESQQMAWGVMANGTALSAVLCGDDPWLKLPIDQATLTQLSLSASLVFEVELGWPMSADYMSLVGMIAPMQTEQQLLRAQASRVTEVLEDHEKLALEHAQLHRAHAELHRQRDELSSQHEVVRRELSQEQHERRHLFAERDLARKEISSLRSELTGMAEHVNNLSNLRSVRYTRKLSSLLGRHQAPLTPPSPEPKIDLSAVALAPLNPPTLSADPSTQPAPPAPDPLSNTVDIIVPVYRGLADTQLCVESVLASTPSTPYRLIVINDSSPEPEVTAWLREKVAKEPRITLLENEENLGFVGTVNRGMKESGTNDVLLLNSDTEVANDWLDRLRRAAYVSSKVASVTPFSSNATICSYPVFCAANPLPPGETTASLDRLFAKANASQVVDVPTGVGFCMYIRRDSLIDTGLFDEEHFGKGYGEENDFCQRAQAKGWRNLHALDTYVLHTGGVSFGDSKSPREQAAMRILSKLHPAYDAQVQTFVKSDPARSARLAVDWLRATEEGRKAVVLAVQHQRGGGTEQHVLELAEAVSDSITFLSLKPAGTHHVLLQLVEQATPEGAPSARVADLSKNTPAAPWRLSNTWRVMLDLETEVPTLVQLLRQLGVAHVHYHHLLGHHQVIWDLPRILAVGYDFTSHDFYSHCTNITLTGKDNHYHEPTDTGDCCGGTHPPSLPAVVEKIEDWRIRNRIFLEGARHLLSPSLDTAQRMQRAFPTAKVRFAPHTDLDHFPLGTPDPTGLAEGRPLRVVVIGALSIIKGADILEETARLAQKLGAAVEFHLIGFGYRHLQAGPGTKLKVHGQYDPSQLPALIQRIGADVAWFPALWPETYSYTLSAALQANLPVVVPDLGAFVERVADRPWSWVQPWNSSPQQWLDLFTAIRAQLMAVVATDVPTAPALPEKLATLAQTLGPWNYQRDYPQFGRPVVSEPERLERAHEVGQFLAAVQHRTTEAEPNGGSLYGLALRLQRAPLLAPIMRSVPQHWRYRIKRLLSR